MVAHFQYLLVFGILPRALVVPIDLPQQKSRMEAMRSAYDEMAKSISQRRLSTALKSNAPAATSSVFQSDLKFLFIGSH